MAGGKARWVGLAAALAGCGSSSAALTVPAIPAAGNAGTPPAVPAPSAVAPPNAPFQAPLKVVASGPGGGGEVSYTSQLFSPTRPWSVQLAADCPTATSPGADPTTLPADSPSAPATALTVMRNADGGQAALFLYLSLRGSGSQSAHGDALGTFFFFVSSPCPWTATVSG